MLRKLGLTIILSLLATDQIKSESLSWYITNVHKIMNYKQLSDLSKQEEWSNLKDLTVLEYLLHTLFSISYTDLLNKDITEKTKLLIENFNIKLYSLSETLPYLPDSPSSPAVIIPTTIIKKNLTITPNNNKVEQSAFNNLTILENFLNTAFLVPYTDLINKTLKEKITLFIEKNDNNYPIIDQKPLPASQYFHPAGPEKPVAAGPTTSTAGLPTNPTVIIPPTIATDLITEYPNDIKDLKAELLEIYKELLGKHRNEDVINILLSNLFNVPEYIYIYHDVSIRKRALDSAFFNMDIKANEGDEKNTWNLGDFARKSMATGAKLSAIKNSWITNKNNVATTEKLLKRLFKYEYNNLLNTNFAIKKLNLQMSFDNLGKMIYNPFDEFDIYDEDNLANQPLTPEEEGLIEEIKRDTRHFKDLKLVEGQAQKGVECGSYAIMHAWAIEQLLEKQYPITARNIFIITRPFVAPGARYLRNQFIHSDEINDQIPKLIADDLKATDFKSRVNYLAYHNLEEPVGVHYTEKPSEPSWFINLGDISLMQSQLKALLTLPPHVQHFLYNTGGHWVLASVVQRPGEDAVIYFIDSMGSSPFAEKVRSRFIITLYENFIMQ